MKLNKILVSGFLFFFFFSVFSSYAAELKAKKNVEVLKVLLDSKKGNTKSVVRGAGASVSKNRGEWTKLAVLYASNPEWADEVLVKFYVLVYNREGEAKRSRNIRDLYTLLTGSVKYANVAASKENRGEMFLHPNTLSRFGEIKEVRVELWYKGVVESFMNQSFSGKKDKGMANWWTQFAPREGELLNKFKVPFVFDADNSFDQIKE